MAAVNGVAPVPDYEFIAAGRIALVAAINRFTVRSATLLAMGSVHYFTHLVALGSGLREMFTMVTEPSSRLN